jgi:hypothetical protein
MTLLGRRVSASIQAAVIVAACREAVGEDSSVEEEDLHVSLVADRLVAEQLKALSGTKSVTACLCAWVLALVAESLCIAAVTLSLATSV